MLACNDIQEREEEITWKRGSHVKLNVRRYFSVSVSKELQESKKTYTNPRFDTNSTTRRLRRHRLKVNMVKPVEFYGITPQFLVQLPAGLVHLRRAERNRRRSEPR